MLHHGWKSIKWKLALVVICAMMAHEVSSFSLSYGKFARKWMCSAIDTGKRRALPLFSGLNNPPTVVEAENGAFSLDVDVGASTLRFESGKIGKLADAAVTTKYGDAIVYSTVCVGGNSTQHMFSALRVDHFSRFSAAGRTSGSFSRKDSRGDDQDILTSRLIDRPLRPCISDGWMQDTQLLSWLLSYDKTHNVDVLAMNSASAAMAMSSVPMDSTVAAVEVGISNSGEIVINPIKDSESTQSQVLSLVLAGTQTGIVMMEGTAEFLPEAKFLEAMQVGHQAIRRICDAIDTFASHIRLRKPKATDQLHILPVPLVNSIDSRYGTELSSALGLPDKQSRGKRMKELEDQIMQEFAPPAEPDNNSASGSSQTQSKKESGDVRRAIKKLLSRHMYLRARQHSSASSLSSSQRTDGRGRREVRPISAETSWLPGTHGSAIFTRGGTQVIATATLGGRDMAAEIDTVAGVSHKNFYLQYRFPPSAVGDVGRANGPVTRREIGHGRLAERALLPCLPVAEEFPYCIRGESLVTESSGSTSMATVCGVTLAMLDAGVPLRRMVAGVAMGLLSSDDMQSKDTCSSNEQNVDNVVAKEEEDDGDVVLTDIIGLEDALGVMDFKIAGDGDGVTAFQLDVKRSSGLSLDRIAQVLEEARLARVHILQNMQQHLSSPRPMRAKIPRILEFTIPPELIRLVIGQKGKTINGLIETFGVQDIDVEDDGSVQIISLDGERNEAAKQAILQLIQPGTMSSGNNDSATLDGKSSVPPGQAAMTPVAVPESGQFYTGRVTSIYPFGVFVELWPGCDGMVHISELEVNFVDRAEDVVAIGDHVTVQCIGFKEGGKVRLSRRNALLRAAQMKNKQEAAKNSEYESRSGPSLEQTLDDILAM